MFSYSCLFTFHLLFSQKTDKDLKCEQRKKSQHLCYLHHLPVKMCCMPGSHLLDIVSHQEPKRSLLSIKLFSSYLYSFNSRKHSSEILDHYTSWWITLLKYHKKIFILTYPIISNVSIYLGKRKFILLIVHVTWQFYKDNLHLDKAFIEIHCWRLWIQCAQEINDQFP